MAPRKKTTPAATQNTAAPAALQQPTLPRAPNGLGEFGESYWNRIGPLLVEAKVLTPIHYETFRVLCEVYQEYRYFHEYLTENLERATFITDSGYEQETPQVRMRDKALDKLQKLWNKFGLTPAALVAIYKKASLGGSGTPEIESFAADKYDEDEDEPPE